MPRQFESASAFNARTGRFEGVSVPSLAELCTRKVFRLAFDPAAYTSISQFLVNGRPICSVRDRAGGEGRPTAFGRSLGATAKMRLPATLLQRLRDGPNAYCAEDGCGAALFTHGALLFVTPGTYRRNKVANGKRKIHACLRCGTPIPRRTNTNPASRGILTLLLRRGLRRPVAGGR